jgi:ribosomal protein S18 acetylase RimI-like enzyme
MDRQVRPAFFICIIVLERRSRNYYFQAQIPDSYRESMIIDLLRIDEYEELLALWDRTGLPYEKDDRDSLEKIEQQIFDDRVAILTLKTDDGQIIGAVIGTYDGRKGWINRLAVDPEYRGRRLATRLMEKVEKMLAEMGATIICALIEDQNTPSMAAFVRCGYEGYEQLSYFRKQLK